MKDEKPSDLHSADQAPEDVDSELRYQAFPRSAVGTRRT
jgi:hypothetical protein